MGLLKELGLPSLDEIRSHLDSGHEVSISVNDGLGLFFAKAIEKYAQEKGHLTTWTGDPKAIEGARLDIKPQEPKLTPLGG